MLREGALAVVLSVLSEQLPRSATATEVACGALWGLAQAKEAAAEVMQSSALTLVYRALETHVSAAGVVECAFWVLWAMALTKEGKARLQTTGVVKKINSARKVHPNSAGVEAAAIKALLLLVDR